MKTNKINEDVAITDPNLAQQYANGKQQLVNKDSQINALNKQVLKLQNDKIKIQQALDQIEKKSAEVAANPTTQNQQNQQNQAQQPENKQLAQAQQALAAQILMNKPTSESLYVANLKNKLISLKETLSSIPYNHPDALSTQIQIDALTLELDYINESSYNPFSKKVFYDVSEAYEDDEDDEYLLYVEIKDKDNKFLAKIFKPSADSKWFGKIIYGNSRTFENITYDSDYEEDDIINFLMYTYDSVRLLTKEEFNSYTEDDIFSNTDHES